ncbi:hypothetical protein ACLOJK_035584 [Asimina triloba]
MASAALTLLLLLLRFSSVCQSLSSPPNALPGLHSCRDTCGSVTVKYPFGTGYGCGHPDFSPYVSCVDGRLQFSAHSSLYGISSIDYAASTLILADPLMSTCASMQNSGSFGLSRASPFNVTAEDIFVLLGCSTSSAVFDAEQELCDAEASHVCRGLYSCKGVGGIGLEPDGPISTCCVYKPAASMGGGGGGGGYQLDLPKLQCSSYACVYGFGESEGDPNGWMYGIKLRFDGSKTTRSDECEKCEASAGICGFTGLEKTFICVCRNGANTTSNCYGQGYTWSGTYKEKRVGILGEYSNSISSALNFVSYAKSGMPF